MELLEKSTKVKLNLLNILSVEKKKTGDILAAKVVSIDLVVKIQLGKIKQILTTCHAFLGK